MILRVKRRGNLDSDDGSECVEDFLPVFVTRFEPMRNLRLKKAGKKHDEGNVFDWQLSLDDETLELGGNVGCGEDVGFPYDFCHFVEHLWSEKSGEFLHGGEFEEGKECLFLALKRAGCEREGRRVLPRERGVGGEKKGL